MGLLDRIWPKQSQLDLLHTPIRSPWASTQLTKIVLNDVYGFSGDITRADAMKVPAVVRGRGLIVNTLSNSPLVAFDYATKTQLPTPMWLTSTKTKQSPIMRMIWTLDDIIFSGMSVWAVERQDGQIVDALRINPSQWSIDPDGLGVLVNGQPVANDQVIIFEGPQEGLINIASDAVRASRNMANAWQQRVESPIPVVELHETDSATELTEAEIDEAVKAWDIARRNGGTAFTPNSIEVKTHGDVATDLFIQGRNAERLDWGNYLNIPAALLDGSMSTATLTYSTSEGKRNEFIDYSLSYWATAIQARLSQDDITPDGTYVRFDLQWLTNPTQTGTAPESED